MLLGPCAALARLLRVGAPLVELSVGGLPAGVGAVMLAMLTYGWAARTPLVVGHSYFGGFQGVVLPPVAFARAAMGCR